jgi:hypothetical protein
MREEKRDPIFIIGPALQHPGTDRMTVLWQTDAEVSGEVVYGPLGAEEGRVKDPRPISLHRNILTGLKPATAYDYSVLAEGRTLFRGSFRTQPKRGPYRVVILGDSHAPAEGFRGLVPRIKEAKPDFIVILGDIVASGLHESNWLAFFEMGRDLFDRVPFTAIIGNHDVKRETVLYDRYVGRLNGAPEGYYYSTAEVGGDYFLFLDSRNDLLFFHQGFWLIRTLRELARRTDIRHVFVFTHLGPASYKGLRRGFIGLKPLLPLMGGAGVSAVFSGHDHHYLRGKTHWGFPFFISGGGGAKLYPISWFNPYAWVVGKREVQAVTHQFLILDVAEEGATVRAVDTKGTTIDEVRLSPRIR